MSVCDKWVTVATFVAEADFVGWVGSDANGCFRRVCDQLKKAGYGVRAPGWSNQAVISGDIFQTYLATDVNKRKAGYQKDQFEAGVEYLKTAMLDKTPVMVGIDVHSGSSSNDKATDHYVTIVGMGTDETGKYFSFYDNATSKTFPGTSHYIGASDKNKIYCDCEDYSLIGKADPLNGYIAKNNFIVTQIRKSAKLPKPLPKKKK